MTMERWTENELEWAIRWWESLSVDARTHPTIRKRIKGYIAAAQTTLGNRLAVRAIIHADRDTETEWRTHFSEPESPP